jgi:hypothetical protein
MHVHVQSSASDRVCTRECARRSRRLWASSTHTEWGWDRAYERSGVAGLDWLSLAVVSGVWWRSGGQWRRLEASVQLVGALVTSASEGEGKVR